MFYMQMLGLSFMNDIVSCAGERFYRECNLETRAHIWRIGSYPESVYLVVQVNLKKWEKEQLSFNWFHTIKTA